VSRRPGGNRPFVLIPMGSGMIPESFEGWASHLASHGYTVLLCHAIPAVTLSQQRAMLSGTAHTEPES